jgi:hypothetical protein
MASIITAAPPRRLKARWSYKKMSITTLLAVMNTAML